MRIAFIFVLGLVAAILHVTLHCVQTEFFAHQLRVLRSFLIVFSVLGSCTTRVHSKQSCYFLSRTGGWMFARDTHC
jgi:hypothetical protein